MGVFRGLIDRVEDFGHGLCAAEFLRTHGPEGGNFLAQNLFDFLHHLVGDGIEFGHPEHHIGLELFGEVA
jgi:hypothetical protein